MEHNKPGKIRLRKDRRIILRSFLAVAILGGVLIAGKMFFGKTDKLNVSQTQKAQFYAYSGSLDLSEGVALSACNDSPPDPSTFCGSTVTGYDCATGAWSVTGTRAPNFTQAICTAGVCGNAYNSCGSFVDCGGCQSGYDCINYTCTPKPAPTCTESCGAWGACLASPCGSGTQSRTCTNSDCSTRTETQNCCTACYTQASCAAYNITCGSYDNGCGTSILCGVCLPSETCSGGTCVPSCVKDCSGAGSVCAPIEYPSNCAGQTCTGTKTCCVPTLWSAWDPDPCFSGNKTRTRTKFDCTQETQTALCGCTVATCPASCADTCTTDACGTEPGCGTVCNGTKNCNGSCACGSFSCIDSCGANVCCPPVGPFVSSCNGICTGYGDYICASGLTCYLALVQAWDTGLCRNPANLTSPTCVAAANGACSPIVIGSYSAAETFPRGGGSLCSAGTVDSNPTLGTSATSLSSVSWNCIGSNGGTSVPCTATRACVPSGGAPTCAPTTDCTNANNCGKNQTYTCLNSCGQNVACSGCPSGVKCPSCNSGNWQEVAP